LGEAFHELAPQSDSSAMPKQKKKRDCATNGGKESINILKMFENPMKPSLAMVPVIPQ
jgi:hypothetical protein